MADRNQLDLGRIPESVQCGGSRIQENSALAAYGRKRGPDSRNRVQKDDLFLTQVHGAALSTPGG